MVGAVCYRSVRQNSNILRYDGLVHQGKNYRCPKLYQNLKYHWACEDEQPMDDEGPEDISEILCQGEGNPPLHRVGPSRTVFHCTAFEDG